MDVQPERLCVALGWHGRFLDGPLRMRVKSRESVWCLSGDDDTGRFSMLHLMLPKDDHHYWRSLFEGGEEKSHMEVSAGSDLKFPVFINLTWNDRPMYMTDPCQSELNQAGQQRLSDFLSCWPSC